MSASIIGGDKEHSPYPSITIWPDVYIRESEESRVLDKNGDPYTLIKRTQLGFDLTPQTKRKPPPN